MSVLVLAVLAAGLAGEPADVTAEVERVRGAHDLPAMGTVVIHGKEIVAQGVSGLRHKGGAAAVTLQDRWHLGSCTKSMTATLCAMLVEDGKLAWDMPLLKAVPSVAAKAEASWAPVTLEMLTTQTAGAPKDLSPKGLWGSLWGREENPREQRMVMLREVVTWKTDHVPGSAFVYSNTNFALAGVMAEEAAGEAYEALIQKRLFGPLGITSAGFGAPGTPEGDDQPWGHTAKGSGVKPGPAADNPPAIAPAGTVHMSLPDWAKYVALHLEGERDGGGKGLLSPESCRRLHTASKGDYAHGWIVTKRAWAGPSQRVLTHNGSNTVWFAVAWLAPEKDMAVLVVCNQGGDVAAKACDEVAGAMVGRFIAPAGVEAGGAALERKPGS